MPRPEGPSSPGSQETAKQNGGEAHGLEESQPQTQQEILEFADKIRQEMEGNPSDPKGIIEAARAHGIESQDDLNRFAETLMQRYGLEGLRHEYEENGQLYINVNAPEGSENAWANGLLVVLQDAIEEGNSAPPGTSKPVEDIPIPPAPGPKKPRTEASNSTNEPEKNDDKDDKDSLEASLIRLNRLEEIWEAAARDRQNLPSAKEREKDAEFIKELILKGLEHVSDDPAIQDRVQTLREAVDISASKSPEKDAEAQKDSKEKTAEQHPKLRERVNQVWEKFTGWKTVDTPEKDLEAAQGNEKNNFGSAELQEARAKLAAIRAFQVRTAWRKVDAESVKSAEEAYREAWNKEFPDILKQWGETLYPGETLTDTQRNFLEMKIMLGEKELRSDLVTGIIAERGGKGSKGITWLREHPKLRVAIGAAALVGGIGLGGVGVAAGGLLVLKTALRGTGTYNSAHGAMEKWTARRDRKEGNRVVGSARNLDTSDLNSMSYADREQLLSNLLLAGTEHGRGNKYAEADAKAIKMLESLQLKEYEDQLKSLPNSMSRDDKIAKLMEMGLHSESRRVEADKKVYSRRVKVAAFLGTGMAVLPLLGSIIEHWEKKDALGPKTKPGPGSPASAYHPTGSEASGSHPLGVGSGGGDAARETAGRVHEHLGYGSADHTWTVRPGENMWVKSHHILAHQEGFKDLNPAQRIAAINSLDHQMGGKNLIHPGEHYEIKAKWVRHAIQVGKETKA